jgi:hypothetical protein
VKIGIAALIVVMIGSGVAPIEGRKAARQRRRSLEDNNEEDHDRRG